jgi:PmbA protein
MIMKHDILNVTEESLTVEVVGGKINSSRNKNISKKGVRLFEGNKIYTTSFVGDISDEELVKKAQGAKSVGIPFEHELPSYTNLKIVDEQSLKDPLEKIQEVIEVTHERLGKFSNEFVFNGKFSRQIYSTTLKNDLGAKLERRFGHNEWYYLFKKVGSPNLMDGYIEQSGRSLDLNDIFDRNVPYLESYNNEIKIQAGKYPVLFIEGGQLAKLSQSLRADKYFEGSALYSGKLNQKIFSDKFSLYDVNYSPEHGLYRKFDEEGTVRQMARLPLIENGTIKNIIADLRNAKKYGVEATGNGQRGFDSAAMLGFNSLVIGAGNRTTQAILRDLDNCVVVFMGHGGDFTDKGEYSTPLQLSYLVQKGEIIGRLPQLTVKTTTDDMFNNRLIEIASDGFQKNHLSPSIFSEMDVFVN